MEESVNEIHAFLYLEVVFSFLASSGVWIQIQL